MGFGERNEEVALIGLGNWLNSSNEAEGRGEEGPRFLVRVMNS